jgi:PAS domain S-box-containing protein
LIFGFLGHRAEQRQRVAEATLIADISSKFVNLPANEVDREILDAERRICELLHLDLVSLWQWSDEAPGFFTHTHLYSAQKGPLTPQRREQDFPWLGKQMRAGRIVVFSSLAELPPEAARDREVARQLGIKSSLNLPLALGGNPPIGVLGLNTTRAERDWPDDLVKWLQLMAQIFASALARKRADQALRESEERLKLATEAADVGLWVWEVARNRFWGSERSLSLFGAQSVEELSFEEAKQRIHPNDRAMVEREFRDALANRSDYEVEYRLVLSDGTERWVAAKGRVVLDATGQPARMLGAVIDITERKRLQHQILEISDREQRRIGQDLHDGLSQHLTGTAMMAKALEYELAATQHPAVAKVAYLRDLLSQAVGQTRALARGLAPVHLGIDGLIVALRRLAEGIETQSDIRCRFTSSPAVFIADDFVASHLYRIAQEAVNNALRHGNAQQITIALEFNTDQGRLTISDDGVGIEARGRRGDGMGLHIMADRSQIIGGSFSVSAGPDGGTVVICSFKQTAPHLENAPPP